MQTLFGVPNFPQHFAQGSSHKGCTGLVKRERTFGKIDMYVLNDPSSLPYYGHFNANFLLKIWVFLLFPQDCQMNHSVIHAVEKTLDATYDDATGTSPQPAMLTNVKLMQEDGDEQDESQQAGTYIL